MAQKKSWSDLTPTQQKLVIAGGVAEAALSIWCLRDLKRRPAEAVRGPKALWVPAMSIQPFGPLAYLTLGRRR